MGSQRENQLRLDLIDEEENIDELLRDTGNFWSAELVRNEENYNKQELMSLEEERISLIA